MEEEKAKKKKEAECCRAEDEAEAAREAKRTAKVQERKAGEESKMEVEEEATSENGTATVADDEGSVRKKARKARKQSRREKHGNKREREAAKTATTAASGATVSPALSSPVGVRKIHTKFSPRKILFKDHTHVHTREFTTASCVLSQEDKYSEFTMKIRALLTEGQKVDEFFAIETIEGGNSKGRWEIPAQVPFNFTEMGENILIPENAKFEQVKPWGRNAKKADGTEADPQDPEVYFTFCFSCDKDPETIMQRVRPEWRRQGGNRLELKELGCYNTETALVLYFLHNECNEQTIVYELSKILEQARKEEKENDKDFVLANNDIPLMSTRILMPKVPGQDTSMYDD